MPRRPRQTDVPSVPDSIRELGYGWALDLVQVLGFVAFSAVVYFVVTHYAADILKTAFDQVGK